MYNVVDDDPAPRGEVAAYAAALTALPKADGAAPAASPLMREPLSSTPPRRDEKRVRNGRIKEELGVVLRFPSYREGLANILQRLEERPG